MQNGQYLPRERKHSPKVMRKNKRFFVSNQIGDLGETEEPHLQKTSSGQLKQKRKKKTKLTFEAKRKSGRGHSPFAHQPNLRSSQNSDTSLN